MTRRSAKPPRAASPELGQTRQKPRHPIVSMAGHPTPRPIPATSIPVPAARNTSVEHARPLSRRAPRPPERPTRPDRLADWRAAQPNASRGHRPGLQKAAAIHAPEQTRPGPATMKPSGPSLMNRPRFTQTRRYLPTRVPSPRTGLRARIGGQELSQAKRGNVLLLPVSLGHHRTKLRLSL